MGRITETVKILLIINIIFFLGSQFVEVAYLYFSMWFPENENFKIWQIFTHMFMHGGFMHILFNMYGLYAFGSAMENIWGQKRFLFFYFSAGLGAVGLQALLSYYTYNSGIQDLLELGASQAQIDELLELPLGYVREEWQNFWRSYNSPMVGASGAIYGILVAFGIYYPNSELMLIFLPFPIKAKYFIPIMIAGDLFFGISGTSTGIAHWAHIGGAVIGFIIAVYWKKNSFNDKRWY
ncbi:rhomboid family intramembrane serine protease [Dokdonia ponticola]|uniref:Rhomboid family intramembrane serine protease n=1 Tax=Dokdonia ponticola TaxID=2041041 RepID=A0ABV9I512_9FLAO